MKSFERNDDSSRWSKSLSILPAPFGLVVLFLVVKFLAPAILRRARFRVVVRELQLQDVIKFVVHDKAPLVLGVPFDALQLLVPATDKVPPVEIVVFPVLLIGQPWRFHLFT